MKFTSITSPVSSYTALPQDLQGSNVDSPLLKLSAILPSIFGAACPTCHSNAHLHGGQHRKSSGGQLEWYRDDEASRAEHCEDIEGREDPMGIDMEHNACRTCAAAQKRSRGSDWILVVLAVICPPAVAYLKTGGHDMCLNILLTLFGWGPGILHAWYLILLHPGAHQRNHHHHHGSCNGHPEEVGHPVHEHQTNAQAAKHTTLVGLPGPEAMREPANTSLDGGTGNLPAQNGFQQGQGGKLVKDTPPRYAAV